MYDGFFCEKINGNTHDVKIGGMKEIVKGTLKIPISWYGGSNVTQIAPRGFEGCCLVTSVEISNHIRNIEDYAFYRCGALENVEVALNGVSNIGDFAFARCSALVSINTLNFLASIGDYAFSECRALKDIQLFPMLISIGRYAFSGCKSLKSIVIPKSVLSVDEFAFKDCSKDLTIYCEAETKPVGWSDDWCTGFVGNVVWSVKTDDIKNDKIKG